MTAANGNGRHSAALVTVLVALVSLLGGAVISNALDSELTSDQVEEIVQREAPYLQDRAVLRSELRRLRQDVNSLQRSVLSLTLEVARLEQTVRNVSAGGATAPQQR